MAARRNGHCQSVWSERLPLKLRLSNDIHTSGIFVEFVRSWYDFCLFPAYFLLDCSWNLLFFCSGGCWLEGFDCKKWRIMLELQRATLLYRLKCLFLLLHTVYQNKRKSCTKRCVYFYRWNYNWKLKTLQTRVGLIWQPSQEFKNKPFCYLT